ncbi:MAG: tail fiber domain-containing protein, partial [Candidatus Saccharimonas sp.]|nr:tail fiber domain-containing protein [Planctomycetaceae bacterium]
MLKSYSWSRRMPVVSWGLMAVLGLGAFSSAQDQTINGDLTLQSASPELKFIDNDGVTYQWKFFPDNFSFDFQDVTGDTIPFRVLPGAPDFSFVIDPNGRIGLGTDDPQARLHGLNPAGPVTFRMEDSSGIPGRWDVEGGGLGFNLKDVTAVTTPFSILPGAPSNSLFVAVNGSVGMGTAIPDANSRVDVRSTLLNGLLLKCSNANAHYVRVENTAGIFRSGVQGNGDAQFGALTPGKGLNLIAGGTSKVAVDSLGRISFGNTPPAITTHALVHQSGAHLTSGGTWTSISSRAAKQDIEPITSEQARDTVRALQPVGYRYKNELEERYVGFIAEDVPELVATHDRKGLAPMD